MPNQAANNQMLKSSAYFKKIVVEDEEAMLTIGEMAHKEIYEKLKINTGGDKASIAIYACIFQAIREVLKDMESKKTSFSINIANRLEVGYTTTFDADEGDEFEKSGNFAMYLKHIPNDSLTEMDRNEENSVVLCTQWNAINITSSIETIKRISKRSLQILADNLAIQAGSPEIIMPMFCIIHQKMLNYLLIKRSEENSFEYKINMAGCFEAVVRQLDDGPNISFKTMIYDKGQMKSDEGASKRYE